MNDKEIELVFHQARSSADDHVEDLAFSDHHTWSSRVESGEKRKRLGEQVLYTAVPSPHNKRSPFSGVFWLIVGQLIAQTLLAILIFVFFLVFVDRRAFNITERRPYYQLADGTEARLPQRNWYPLQSDITTIISGAFNLLGKCYSAWIAAMTWNYAFLLLERNGMQLKSLSSMISLPFLPSLFPPAGYEPEPTQATDESLRNHGSARRWLALSITLTILSAFPASFSPPIATGSISWHASTRDVVDADTVYDIGSQGSKFGDIYPWSSWCGDVTFRPRYIQRATGLATHAWNSVVDTPDIIPTFKRVVPSVENLPVGSSLNNITVPMFVIESFDWITDASDVSSAQLAYLTPSSTPGILYTPNVTTDLNNPLLSTPGVLALLPDVPYTSLPFDGSTSNFQPSMIQNKTGVVAVSVNYAAAGSAAQCGSTIFGNAIFGSLPPNVFTTGSENVFGYWTCFIFAKITYSAGAATCYGCEVVFPLVVQNPAGVELTLQADEATQLATYVMADVIGQLASANVTLPNIWNHTETYTREMLVRGYSSAWAVMSEMIAYYGPLPSTAVTIPIPTSEAIVDLRRLWGWFALQILAFVGGVIFVVHIRMANRYPISNPLIHGIMLDVNIAEVAGGHSETWTDEFKATFITWERSSETSTLTIKGGLRRAKKPLYRRVLSRCFGCSEPINVDGAESV